MFCKKLLCYLLLISSLGLYAQGDFYNSDTIREIRISFSEENWDEILDSLYVAGEKQRMQATLFVDGYRYDSVGVRYKGYSSSSVDRIKNPFNIKLNYIIKGQKHMGIDKIKLSNIIQDPSFLREVLSYDIARKYMPASKANFANVYVNDTLIGLYTNVEAVNNEFLEKHFRATNNVLVKGNPETVDLYGENSNLSDSPGTDSLSYQSLYSMESDYGWSKLYSFIDTLNNNVDQIHEVLNIDRALWMHAVNYSIINFDSYIGYAQNYYLYEDIAGRFNPILWDLNMSFASFRLTDASSNFDGFSIAQAKTIDPLTHYNDFSVFPRPLLRNLFESKRNRLMYMAHIRTIMQENFANQAYVGSIESYKALIDQSVVADSNKFYTYNDFLQNSDTTVSDLIDYPGIIDLMEGRLDYLRGYPGYEGEPVINNLTFSPEDPEILDSISISVSAENSTDIILFYRRAPELKFQELPMIEYEQDYYACKLEYQNSNIDFYIYAENDSAGAFYPQRAAYEYFTIYGGLNRGDLVINELMASNVTYKRDGSNDYDDWIELYNNSALDISLSGLFLSDDAEDLTKWALPEQIVESDTYIVFWADSEEVQGENHTNFKLSSGGEGLFLSDQNLNIIDSIYFGEQLDDIAYGRWPNATGEFTYITPTIGENNDLANLIPESSSLYLEVYPNPISEILNIRLQSQYPSTVRIYDMLGRLVVEEVIDAGITTTEIPAKKLQHGLYIVGAISEDQTVTKKIVKL